MQVRDLISLFRPCKALIAPPLAQMPEILPLRARLPSALEDHIQPSVRLPMLEDPYLAGPQYGRAAMVVDPHPVRYRVLPAHRELYGNEATMDRVYPIREHQNIRARDDPYYFADNRQVYIAGGSAQIVQDRYPR